MPQYSKTTWVNDSPPAIDAERLNKIENGIFDALPKDGSVAMTGQLVTTAGSAATPAIAPTGDSNTGVFFPSADTLSLGTAGGERVRINSSGNIGVGITDQSYKLDVAAYAATPLRVQRSGEFGEVLKIGRYGVSDGAGIGYPADNTFTIITNANERMRITSSGNVGIGTLSPTRALEISSATNTYQRLTSTIDASCFLEFNTNGVARANLTGDGNGLALKVLTSADMYFHTNNQERMRIISNGNVGIGTTSIPSVFGTTVKVAGSTGATIQTSATNVNLIQFTSDALSLAGVGTVTNHPLQLLTNDTERMRITSTGSVGIGDFASNPPPVQFSVSSLTGGVVGVTTKRGSGTNASPIPMSYGFYGYLDSEKARITATERTGNTNASDLNFLVKDSSDVLQSRLYISTSGNVGINTSSPGDKLHVEGNFYLGTASRTIYTAGTGNLTLQTGTGNIIFSRNNAADTTMFLNNSGNVGIGTNSPTSELHVYSAASSADIMVETNATGGDAKIALKTNGTGGRHWYWQTGDNASTLNGRLRLVDSTAGAERLTITSTGNVGIGTTNTDLGTYGATAKVVTLLSSTGFGVHELASGVTPADSNVLGVVSFVNNGSGIITPVGAQIVGFQSGSHASYAGGKLIFYTRANGSTSLSERLTITDSGNVGIGTINPTVAANVTTLCLNNTSGSQAELFVNGTRTGIFTASSTTVSLRNLTANPLLFFTNSIERLHIESGGNVRPSANNSQELGSSLYRWSTIYAQNALNTSDARLKTDVESSSLGLDFISALNPVQFRYIEGGNTVERVQTGTETVEITPAIPAQPEQEEILDEEGNVIQAYVPATEEVPAVTEEQPVFEEVVTAREGVRTHFGLIAQEVKAALPDGLDFGGWALADKDDAESTQFLGYMELIGPMIKAIQELNAKVEALEAQLNK